MYKEMFFTEELENMVEEYVFEEIHNAINEGKIKFCQCKICIQDIAAIVLNIVPPSYMSSIVEKYYVNENDVKVIEETKALIKKEVQKAIQKVKKSPHH